MAERLAKALPPEWVVLHPQGMSHCLPNTCWKMPASMLKIRSAFREATQFIFRLKRWKKKSVSV